MSSKWRPILLAVLVLGCDGETSTGDSGAAGMDSGGMDRDGGGGTDAGDTGHDATSGHDSGAGGTDAGPLTGHCFADADCQDGRFCNGVEICASGSPSADEHGCAPGTPPCTGDEQCVEAMDMCRPSCATPDVDMDGHDATYCAGDDCDDTDPSTYMGATERCDMVDNDCDSALDEGVTADAWYGDCDGDTYPGPDGFVLVCPRPTAVPPGCTNPAGTWTLRSPAMGLDCDDNDASRHPGGVEIVANGFDDDCDGTERCLSDLDGDTYASAVEVVSSDGDCSDPGEALAGGPVDCCDTDANTYPGQTAFFAPRNACLSWDYDCDTTEELQYPMLYHNCTGCSGGMCIGAPDTCVSAGFVTSRVPDCNETAPFASCTCTSSTGGGSRAQRCR
ncbi:MAG: putative metal-binding motif-containing protein [Sandaracinaceae bacterium]